MHVLDTAKLIQTLLHNHKLSSFANCVTHPCTRPTATHTPLPNAFMLLVKHPKPTCQIHISHRMHAVMQLSDAHAYKKAGDKAYYAKRFPEALDQYSKSIATLPDNAVLLNNRASVYLKLRRWEEAKADSFAALCSR